MVLLRSGPNKFGDMYVDITNVVVAGSVIPTKNGEYDWEREVALAHVEDQFLIPHRVSIVPDDLSALDLISKSNFHIRVHVPTDVRDLRSGQ